MKAITVKQPWASLIVEGIKDIENRTWKCPQKYIGKRVLIHSSQKPLKFNGLGEILTRAQFDSLNGDIEPFMGNHCGSIIGSVEIVDCIEGSSSIWAENIAINKYIDGNLESTKMMKHWVLANPIKFNKPIPCKGKLSFWDYPNILAEPEEENGELFCHCSLPVKEENQVSGYSRFGFYCRYCGGKWYK